ncbi:MAG: phosphotransferase [Clostridia bacterium]|nr:phosphotransferase [Clostridia bacterium]
MQEKYVSAVSASKVGAILRKHWGLSPEKVVLISASSNLIYSADDLIVRLTPCNYRTRTELLSEYEFSDFLSEYMSVSKTIAPLSSALLRNRDKNACPTTSFNNEEHYNTSATCDGDKCSRIARASNNNEENNKAFAAACDSDSDNFNRIAPVPCIRTRIGGEYFWMTVTTRARGRHIKYAELWDFSNGIAELWGEALGLMHKLTKTFRPRYPRFSYDCEPSKSLYKKALGSFDIGLLNLFESSEAKMANLNRGVDDYGLLHYDMHYGNFFIYGESLELFDFDDCCYAHFIADFAVVAYALTWEPLPEEVNEKLISFMKEFCKGYRKHNILDKKWFLCFDIFYQYRLLLVLSFLLVEFDRTEMQEHIDKIVNLIKTPLDLAKLAAVV